jgi:FMN-dependent NADH-azoreductase
MKTLFINASPHSDASHGHRLASELLDAWRKTGCTEVIERDLAASPLTPITRDYASAITSREPDPRQFELSEQLIAELEATDALVINTPMHNFTVPAALKLWIDYVLRIGRTFVSTPEGKVGLMRDRPVYVIVGSGGFHQGEHARQPDFLTPYLRYALASIGISDVHFILLQGLVMGDEAVARQLAAAREEIARHARFAHTAQATQAAQATRDADATLA